MATRPWNENLGCAFVALLLLGCIAEDSTTADQPTDRQNSILAELESRWWGWSYGACAIVPEPKSWKLLNERWHFADPAGVLVLIGAEASPQEIYIAQMLRREFALKHKIPCRVVTDAEAVSTGNPVICLGTLDSNSQLAKLSQARQIDRATLEASESYAIDFFTEPSAGGRWVLVVGGDPIGCVHGGFSLMQLIKSSQQKVTVDFCVVRDFPSVAVRSLRGVGEFLGMKLQTNAWSNYLDRAVTPEEIHTDELMLPCLDRLARNRINCFHLLAGMKGSAQLPDRLPHLIREAHRRGIQVVGGFRPVGAGEGDRGEGRTHPCYLSEEDVQKVLGFYRQYIDAGCDFLYFMADDYEKDKLAGHCPKCIEKFGGLAGEQKYMLHRILDLADEKGFSNDKILFCPTHYDVDPGPNYLEVFNADARLKNVQYTFTYLTEELIEKRKLEFPNVRYSLFYNGPRWLAYYHRHPPATARALARYSRNSLYFPVYFGWHSARYDPALGWFTDTTEAVRRNFEVVIPRQTAHSTLLGNIANYSDSIFKGPVEYALWGHYCWNPARHDTRQSEVVIGDAVFGPGNGKTMAQLNRVLFDLTRIFFEDVPVADEYKETLKDRLELARLLHRRLVDGYGAYRNRVADDYIPPTQNFYVELGLKSIEKNIGVFERCARQRGLTGKPGPVGPSARYAGVVFPSTDPDEFFLSGGAQGDLAACLSDLYRYRIPENRWECLAKKIDSVPPLCGHSAVSIGGKVWIFGGSPDGPEHVQNALYVFDQQTGRFSRVEDGTGEKPAGRFVHAACADGQGRMWIFGGLTVGHKDLGDLYVYSPEENQWHPVKDAKGETPGPRYGTRLAAHGNSLYLFGGSQSGAGRLGDFHRFDLNTRTWHRLSGTAGDVPGPRYAHAFITVNETIYLFGGGGRQGYLNDLYAYEPSADRWRKLAPEGRIPGPIGCTLPLCPDGNRIFFYSGAQPAASFDSWINGDLYCYDIRQNRFTKLYSYESW